MKERAAGRLPSLFTALGVYRLMRRSARSFRRAARDERGLRELVRQSRDGRLLEPVEFVAKRPVVAAPISKSTSSPGKALHCYEIGPEVRPKQPAVSARQSHASNTSSSSDTRICEIGTSAGGTLYLLTRVGAPDALVVSIDLSIPRHTAALCSRFARPGQRLVSIAGDSHSEETVAKLERVLAGEQLDALFIDGDHSYEGVRADFERYAPLVRGGGIVALHDVNEDFRTRRGFETPSISGEVPRFWRELKERYRTEELIADPEQDGYGIGLVYV